MWRGLVASCLAVSLRAPIVSAVSFECDGPDACKARMDSLVERLAGSREALQKKQQTVAALEELRMGVLTGKRVELPSAQRQHLERGCPVIAQVTFDARHRPLSTNVSRHFKPMHSVATSSNVRFQSFLPLKKSSGSQGGGSAALLVTIDAASRLAIWSLEGVALLEDFDLGHGEGRKVTHMVTSPPQDNPFVLTVDDEGTIRIHNFKVAGAKKEKGAKSKDGGDGTKERKPSQFAVSANFSNTFSLPTGPRGELRPLTSVVPVERGSQTWFVISDSLGGISVFFRNGTMKGRVRVTEDPGGVTGLSRSQGGSLLFSSAYSFGFFSPAQLDVQFPACTGWNSPLVDIAMDPGSSKVILALQDGDILVFVTSSGKSKACDLTLKFPHVSTLPFKLYALKGHVMALPTIPPDVPQKGDYLREIYFFNLAIMDGGYGVAPSRAVALQASFKPRQPDDFAVTTSSGDRAKSHIAIRFEGEPGIEIFELSLKQPAPPKGAGGSGGAAGGGEEGGLAGWLNWFPKVGVFGLTLVGVVFWNVRKVTGQKKGGGSSVGSGGLDDFDEDFFKKKRELLAEKRAAAAASGGAGGDGGGLDLGFGDNGGGAGDAPRVEEVGDDND